MSPEEHAKQRIVWVLDQVGDLKPRAAVATLSCALVAMAFEAKMTIEELIHEVRADHVAIMSDAAEKLTALVQGEESSDTLKARAERAEKRVAELEREIRRMCDCDAGVPDEPHDPECASLQTSET